MGSSTCNLNENGDRESPHRGQLQSHSSAAVPPIASRRPARERPVDDSKTTAPFYGTGSGVDLRYDITRNILLIIGPAIHLKRPRKSPPRTLAHALTHVYRLWSDDGQRVAQRSVAGVGSFTGGRHAASLSEGLWGRWWDRAPAEWEWCVGGPWLFSADHAIHGDIQWEQPCTIDPVDTLRRQCPGRGYLLGLHLGMCCAPILGADSEYSPCGAYDRYGMSS
eukprot:gene9315-240_t